jgi:hypothetical protein
MNMSWGDAVQRASAIIQANMPVEMHGRIQRGTALVLDGKVWLEENGHACQVYSTKEERYYDVNGTCDCIDFPRAPQQVCKHRAARGVYIRAQKLMATGMQAAEGPTGIQEGSPPTLNPALQEEPPAGIDPKYLVSIHGKAFIRYAGLLAMAHAAGLIELHADFTFNGDTLAVAHVVAVFKDGRRFSESGDSTPENVGPHVGTHWRRLSLTRAKSRCLRDALGIDMAAAEEME